MGTWGVPVPSVRRVWPGAGTLSLTESQSRAGFLLLMAMALILCVATYPQMSATYDEPEHLAAGMERLDRGTYSYDVQHPPLARIAFATGPYLLGIRSIGRPGPWGDWEGRDLLYTSADPRAVLTLARLGAAPFLLLFALGTWLWARRLLGPTQALLAGFFVLASPPVLGHAGVAALDVPGASLCLLSLYGLVRWLEAPSLKTALLLGVPSGLALATKLSSLPFLCVSGVGFGCVALLCRPAQTAPFPSPARRYLLGGLTALLLAAGILGAIYGGGVERLDPEAPPLREAVQFLSGGNAALREGLQASLKDAPLPVGLVRLVQSVQELKRHNEQGHLSYFLGRLEQKGWWYYYPVALGIKTPLPLLLLGLGGLGILLFRGRRERRWTLASPPAAFAFILAFSCAYSNINIGIRHVLILYPFLAMGAAAALAYLWRRGRRPILRAAAALLLFWHLLVPMGAYPDFLAYFNPLAGPEPENVLIDSDLDWGQELVRLAEVVRLRKIDALSIAYRGGADPFREDLPRASMLPPGVTTPGWVAINILTKALAGKGYAWLDAYKPVERIGKSFYLYFIPPR